jgi:hypothetical protein
VGGHGILERTGDLATGDLAIKFRRWGGHGILEHTGSGCQVQEVGGSWEEEDDEENHCDRSFLRTWEEEEEEECSSCTD